MPRLSEESTTNSFTTADAILVNQGGNIEQISKSDFIASFAPVEGSLPLKFDADAPQFYGSESSPITGSITIDPTDALLGRVVCVYFSGSAAPVFTGATVIPISGAFDPGKVNRLFIMREASGFVLSIPTIGGTATGGADTTPPTLASTTITDSTRNQLTVVFSEAVNIASLTGLSLTGTSATLQSIAGTGTKNITFTLSQNAAAGETITLVYTGTNTVTDLAGNALAAGSTGVVNQIVAQNQLAAPQNLAITNVQQTTCTVSVGTVTNATGYVLEYSTNADFAGATVLPSQAGTTWNLTGLTANTPYYFRVVAVDNTALYSASPYSSTVTKTTLANAANLESIPGLMVALLSNDIDADGTADAYIDGTKVAGWNDKSTFTNHATQTDVAKQFTFRKESHYLTNDPALDSTGAVHKLAQEVLLPFTGCTIVFAINNASGYIAGSGISNYLRITTTTLETAAGATSLVTTFTTPLTDLRGIYLATFDGTGVKVYRNNVLIGTNATARTTAFPVNYVGAVDEASATVNNANFSGKHYAFAAWNRVVNEAERGVITDNIQGRTNVNLPVITDAVVNVGGVDIYFNAAKSAIKTDETNLVSYANDLTRKRDLKQPDTTAQPLYNGTDKWLDFTGGKRLLFTSLTINRQAFSHTFAHTTNASNYMTLASGTNNYIWVKSATQIVVFGTTINITSGSFAGDTIVTLIGSASAFTIHINGALCYTGAALPVGSIAVTEWGSGYASERYKHKLRAFAVASKALTESERQTVEGDINASQNNFTTLASV